MRLFTLTLLEISCLQAICKVFTIWPPVTSNDLWPPQKIIGIIYAIWPTYILNMRSLTFTLLEISCLQGFDLLTSRDPKWPLTSTKNNRDHLLNMVNSHPNYEISHTYPSWDIVFTSKASHTHTHTSVLHIQFKDLFVFSFVFSSLTLTLTIDSLLFNFWGLEKSIEFPSKDLKSIVQVLSCNTKQVHIHTHIHTHTHTRHHHRIDSLPAFGKESKMVDIFPHQVFFCTALPTL